MNVRNCSVVTHALGTLLAATTLVGCAADTSQIEPTDVPWREYDNYACDELREEAERLTVEARDVGARVDETAALDDVKAAGLILLWPILFVGDLDEKAENFDTFLPKGNTGNTSRYAKLKGRINAIEEASQRKDCAIVFKPL